MGRKHRLWARALSVLLLAAILGTMAPGASALEASESDWSKLMREGSYEAFERMNERLAAAQPGETKMVQIANAGEIGTSVTASTYGLNAAMELAAPSSLQLITPSNDSSQGNHRYPVVSDDGTIIAFASDGSGLVSNDSNGSNDIFVYDSEAMRLSRVSVDSHGSEADGDSWAPVLSADGLFVVFSSEASNLTERELALQDNLYLHNRLTGETELIAEGVPAVDESGLRYYALSADGRYVAFFSEHNNGVDEDHNANWDVFWKDLYTGAVQRITDSFYYDHSAVALAAGSSQPGTNVSISGDGRYVAFDSGLSNLVEGDTNNSKDIFVYDAWSGTVERVSVSTGGQQGDGDSQDPMISASGDYVVFESSALNLAEGEHAQGTELYVHDRRHGTTVLVGDLTYDSWRGQASISADGRYVAYRWTIEGQHNIYITDRQSGTTEMISKNVDGEVGNGDSDTLAVTADGKHIVFASAANNLTGDPGEDNGAYWDIYKMELNPAEGEAAQWPEAASARADQVGGTYAVLSWPQAEQPAEGAVYRVSYTEAGSGEERIAGITEETQLLIPGLKTGQSYVFQIRAGNAKRRFHTEPLQISVETLPTSDPTPPSPPADVVLSAEDGMLRVTWEDPGDADFVRMDLYWKKAASDTYRKYGLYTPGQQQAVIPGIANQRMYDVMLRAVDADGNEATIERSVRTDEGIALERILTQDGKQMKHSERWDRKRERDAVDVSGNGRYIVFSSDSHNLIPGESPGTAYQIYLYDSWTDKLLLISRDIHTGEPLPGDSQQPRISSDGRYLVFASRYEEGGEWKSVVYYYDRDADGNGVLDEHGGTFATHIYPEEGGFDSLEVFQPDVSNDGTTVAFLVGYEDESEKTVHLVNMESDTHSLVYESEYTEILLIDLSADGNHLAIADEGDLEIHHLATGEFSEIAPAVEGDRPKVGAVSLSGDGRYLAYAYHWNDAERGVYMYDLATGRTYPVTDTEPGEDIDVSISGDGRYVAYTGNMEIEDVYYGQPIIHRYDTETGATRRIDVSLSGELGNGNSTVPVISDDGSTVVFRSLADNLMPGDTNHQMDIYYAVLEHAAMDTAAPTWPEGSVLRIADATASSVTLEWGPAIDNTGVQRYVISYGEGATKEVGGSVLSTTIEDLRPETAYAFTVMAIDASGNRSEAELHATATTDASATPEEIEIQLVRANVPQVYRGLTATGEQLQIALFGDPGLEAQAVVQTVNAAGEAAEHVVELTEVAEGRYTGSYAIAEGIAEMAGLKGILRDRERTQELDADGFEPLAVGGNIALQVHAEDAASLAGGYLSLSSRGTVYPYVTGVLLDGPGFYAIKGLPAGTYDYAMRSADGVLLHRGTVSEPIAFGASITEEILIPPPSYLIGRVWADGLEGSSTTVMVTDREGRILFHQRVSINAEEGFRVNGLIAGETIVIHIASPAAGTQHLEAEVVIQSGENARVFALEPKPKGGLTGRVLDFDDAPIPGAIVKAMVSTEQGVFEAEAVSAADGSYELDLVEGSGRVFAEMPDIGSTEVQDITIVAGAATELDLAYSDPIRGRLELKLFTKHVGGEWVGPIDLDAGILRHFRYTVSRYEITKPSGGTLHLMTNPGDAVTVCVNGVDSNLPGQCGEAVMDEHNRAVIELRLEQVSMQVKARFPAYSSHFDKYRIRLYKIDEDGKRTEVLKRFTPQDVFLEVQEPGSYSMEFNLGYLSKYGTYMITERTFREFDLAAGDIVDLGSIEMTDSAWHYRSEEGNATKILPTETTPGETVQVRTTFKNTGNEPTEQAKAVLEIPAGTELAANSVTLNGKLVAPAVLEPHQFMVDLGTVESGEEGVVSYHLRLAEDYEAAGLSVTQNIQYTMHGAVQTNWLGDAYARVIPVKLEAPEITGLRDITVGGLAPIGTIVSVYDGDLLLGQTFTLPSGLWEKTIRLPGEAQITDHRLWVKADRGAKQWTSEVVPVRYEHDYPEVISGILKQLQGREVGFDSSRGVARFPYTYVPGKGLTVSFRFQNASRVRNVKLHVGGDERPMGRSGLTGFTGYVTPDDTGPIYVSYDVARKLDLPDFPSPEEQVAEAPKSFQDMVWQVVDSSDGSTTPGRAYAVMNGTAMVDGEEASIHYEASMEEADYEPTQADLNASQETGSPVYGLTFDYTMTDEGLVASLEGYIPKSELQAMGMEDALAMLSGGTAKQAQVTIAATAKEFIKVSHQILVDYNKPIKGLWDVYEYTDDLKDTWENMSRLDKLNALRDIAVASCGPDFAHDVTRRAESIANQFMAHEVVKWTLMVAGVALGPETFGLGTLLMFAVSEAIEGKLDDLVDKRINSLRDEIANTSDCEKTEPKKRKVADPAWIYDPSGYVYEVEESNRIEGAVATVYYWDAALQQWKPWDAEWYGQHNPLLTDREGKYAWDVPEGKWKVVYQKEGYLTAESDELIVLPPHTDVNIGMVSTLPPSVTYVMAAPGGGQIDIHFDRHVAAAALNGWVVTVSKDGEDGEALIEGTVTVEEGDKVPYVASDGTETIVTRKAVFTPSTPLVAGETYTVKVSQGIPSYHGVPMMRDHMEDVLVAETDVRPPGEASNVSVYAAADTAELQWEDPADPDLSHIEIRWRRAGDSAYEGPLTVPAGTESAVVAPLSDGTAYEFVVRAVDAAGNASEVAATQETAVFETIPDMEPPEPVDNVAAVAAENGLVVTWSENEDSDHQAVIVSWQEAGQNGKQTGTALPGTGRFVASGLKSDTEYKLTVAAVDEAGNRSAGAIVFAKTGSSAGPDPDPEHPSEPSQPSNGSAGAPATGPTGENEAWQSFQAGSQGGTYEAFDGALALLIPHNTFPNRLQLQIARQAVAELQQDEAGSWRLLSDVYEIVSDGGAEPLQPITITLAYDPAKLNGADVRKLGIYRQSEEHPGRWIYQGGKADAAAGVITTDISVFGSYAVLLYDRSFTDLGGHWGQEDVEVLVSRHYVHGLTNGRFEPNRPITRAELTKLMVELGKRLGKSYDPTSAPVFVDVMPSDWHYAYVNDAVQLGLVTGYNGRFRPNDPVTREEMAVMVAGLLDLQAWNLTEEEPALGPFVDAEHISGWAKPSVSKAVQLGILRGNDAGQLNPRTAATRAESASVLLRLLDLLGLLEA